MRGVILNPARRCPSCGEETMRGEMPFLLAPLELVLGAACSYRWCRRCRRTWLALHRAWSAAPLASLPVLRNAPSGLTGGWVAQTGALTWRLALAADAAGVIAGGGALEGSGTSFPLRIRGQSAGDRVTLQVEAAGSRMEFRARLTSPGSMDAKLYLGDTPRPLTLLRLDEQAIGEPVPAWRSRAA
jgi:hypothetical protein